MDKSEMHQYKLRVSKGLKDILVQIAGQRHRSVGAQIIETVKRIDSQAANVVQAPASLLSGSNTTISINFPARIFNSLKAASRLKKMSVNDEILDRIYWSNPQSELDYLNGKSTSSNYPTGKLDRGMVVNETQGLCTQTEDERIMLEKYRAMSAVQRTQMQAISDTIYEPKKIGMNK